MAFDHHHHHHQMVMIMIFRSSSRSSSFSELPVSNHPAWHASWSLHAGSNQFLREFQFSRNLRHLIWNPWGILTPRLMFPGHPVSDSACFHPSDSSVGDPSLYPSFPSTSGESFLGLSFRFKTTKIFLYLVLMIIKLIFKFSPLKIPEERAYLR